jgi:hypothetical protein
VPDQSQSQSWQGGNQKDWTTLGLCSPSPS